MFSYFVDLVKTVWFDLKSVLYTTRILCFDIDNWTMTLQLKEVHVWGGHGPAENVRIMRDI